MDPGVSIPGEGNDRLGGIERPTVDVASLQAHNSWPRDSREGVCAHASLVIYRYADDTITPKPQ